MARKNIKVPEDLFMALRDDKDDQQSWPHYLEEQCLHDPDPEAYSVPIEAIDEWNARLKRIEEQAGSTDTAALIDDLVAQLPPKIAEELR